jgi:hypothetical protein
MNWPYAFPYRTDNAGDTRNARDYDVALILATI